MLVLHINTYSTRVGCWYYRVECWLLHINTCSTRVECLLHINTYSMRVECCYYTLILIV